MLLLRTVQPMNLVNLSPPDGLSRRHDPWTMNDWALDRPSPHLQPPLDAQAEKILELGICERLTSRSVMEGHDCSSRSEKAYE